MDYYTPVKDNQTINKQTKTAVQPREGDWICLNCHNLNFSFRKKCNRCKVQTKQQNQSSTALIIDYYNKTYYSAQNAHLDSCRPHDYSNTTDNSVTHSHTPPKYNKNRSNEDKENRTPSTNKRDLPSVSPLIKKYKERQSTPLSELGTDQNIWGIPVRDFDSLLSSSRRSDEVQPQRNCSSQLWEEQSLQYLMGQIML